MTYNFLEPTCQTATSEKKFGLCDDGVKAAYVSNSISDIWIAEVENPDAHNVIFTAIDHCIDLRRADKSLESRCDGMLTYDTTIIFVELKDRQSSGWISKGVSQLTNTIRLFALSGSQGSYVTKKAYLANRQRPNFNSAHMVQMQSFKNDTGYLLTIKAKIEL